MAFDQEKHKMYKILNSGTISDFSKEIWISKQLNFEINQKSFLLERLKEATKCLLETNFEDFPNKFPTITADINNSIMYDCAETVYEMFETLLLEHVKTNLLPKLKSVKSKNLFRVLVSTWLNYKASMEKFGSLFLKLDETLQHRKKLKVCDLGLKTFVNEIVLEKEMLTKIKKVFKKSIEKHRKQVPVDVEPLEEFTCMLSEMHNDQGKSLYSEVFERFYLEHTEKFCEKVSGENVAKMTSYEYVDQFCKFRYHEKKLVSEKTKKKFDKIVFRIFINDKFEKVVNNESSGLAVLLKTEEKEKVLKVCEPFVDNNHEVEKIQKVFVSHFISKSKQMIDDYDKKNPDLLIVSLANLQNNLNGTIKYAFKNDWLASTYELIKRELSKLVSGNGKMMAEGLSVFMDRVLKGGDEGNWWSDLEKFARFFKATADKDYFNLVYHRHLSKRLLASKSCQIAKEKLVVARMKKCMKGGEHTSKFEIMFKDLEFSKKFNEARKAKSGFETKVQILTPCAWPVKTTHAINMPPAITRSFGEVNEFYRRNYNEKRNLKLCYQHGSAEVAFFRPGKEDKLLQVDNFQMALLMLFNARSQWTVKDVAMETKMPIKVLVSVLRSLTQGKKGTNVLLKVSSGEEEELGPEDAFEVNELFENPRRKIKVPPTKVPGEERKQDRMMLKKHATFRKESMRAAVVRVMKRRRRVEGSVLIAEVVKELEGKFKPEVREVKKCLEGLIKQEYVERDAEDGSKYLYVS